MLEGRTARWACNASGSLVSLIAVIICLRGMGQRQRRLRFGAAIRQANRLFQRGEFATGPARPHGIADK